MKVIMVTEKDAANASLGKIADAFIKHNNSVEIYAIFSDDTVMRFFSKEIPVYRFSDLTKEKCEDADVIFTFGYCSTFFVGKDILTVKKPIFTYNYCANGQFIWGGDVCFVPALETTGHDFEQYIKYPRIAVGEPKYDGVTDAKGDCEKVFLFLDSGHRPFGEKGKYELARTLLHICEKFPDYELKIKPRFLPEDMVVTHRNYCHLYDVINEVSNGNIPTNMTLLKEHKDLIELIEECETVICLHTTAYTAACICDKGIVGLEGISDEDVYDPRKKNDIKIQKIMDELGMLVHYEDVETVLPQGIRCSNEEKRKILAETENAADKVVEICTWLCKEFFNKGRFPRLSDSCYSNYKETTVEQIGWTWEKYLSHRYKGFILARMIMLIDSSVNGKLDITSIMKKVNNLEGKGIVSEDLTLTPTKEGYISETAFLEFQKKMYQYRKDCIVDNHEVMYKDPIDAGILMSIYYEREQDELIYLYPNKDIGAYLYFCGMIEYRKKDYEKAKEYLEKYINITCDRNYVKEITDLPEYRFRAYFRMTRMIMAERKYDIAKAYISDMKQKYEEEYSYKKGEITNSIQGQQYMYISYLYRKYERETRNEETDESNDTYIVYGAGVISREILLNDERIKKQIRVFIDKNCAGEIIDDIPVVSLEDIDNYNDTNKVLIAVPHLYSDIYNDIVAQSRRRLEVCSVELIF